MLRSCHELQFKIRVIHKVGFAEGLEGFLEVDASFGDRVGGLEVGLDFGVEAWEAVNLVEID